MKKRVGIINGGGDCQGLNTVLNAIVHALQKDYDIYGFVKGYEGLLTGDYILLTSQITSPIRRIGGTILKTVNKGIFTSKKGAGDTVEVDPELIERTYQKYTELGLDGLIILGGDGTLSTTLQMQRHGFNIIGIPKSIDNDLQATDFTFGFQSAVQVVSDALDSLHTTASSHERVMICEVMGRHAGWIGLYGGIAGGANCVLVPEVPFSYTNLIKFLEKRKAAGRNSTVMVVCEGAKPVDGHLSIKQELQTSVETHKNASEAGSVGSPNSRQTLGELHLGGLGDQVADYINKNTDFEARCTNLGHLQRGGSPNAFDRVLSTLYGTYAAELFRTEQRGMMVSYQQNKMSAVPIVDAVSKLKIIDPKGQLVTLAKTAGIYIGE